MSRRAAFPSPALALEMMPLRIRSGETARDLLPELEELLNKFQAFPYGHSWDHAVFSIGGIVGLEAGEFDLARRLLEKSALRWRENGARQNLAGVNLLLAHVHLLQGDEKTADSLLRSALAAAQAGQWLDFMEWHDETVYTMCRRAVLKNIQAEWATRLLCRWFPSRWRRELGCLLLSPDEQLRSLVAFLFHDMAKDSGTTLIHAFYLGGFRLFIKWIGN